jgi:hypothetical protein
LPFDSEPLAASRRLAGMFTTCSMKRLASAAAAALALAGLAACGSDSKHDAKNASTAAAAPAPPANVYGTYERTVTHADLDRTKATRDESGPNQELPPTGVYRLTLARGTAQDALKATDPQQFVVGMDVTLDGHGSLKATSYIDPNQGAFCGPQIPAPGDYTYAAHGTELVLKATDDPCADRDSVLSGVWKRT